MFLSVTSHNNYIVARWPDKRCLSHGHVPLSSYHDAAMFKWRSQWHWIDTKIDNDVIIAGLKSKPTCKLINRMNTMFASFDI